MSSQSNPQEDDSGRLSGDTLPAISTTTTTTALAPQSTSSGGQSIARNHSSASEDSQKSMFRSRKTGDKTPQRKRKRRKNSRARGKDDYASYASTSSSPSSSAFGRARGGIVRKFLTCIWKWLTRSPTVAAGTVPTQAASFSTPRTSRWMGFLARGVLWTTVVSLTIAVIFYSYELFNHGTDPHLVAWFSAGAFVLMGFPISMWAIVSHLANYNQPHVQVYIVRILWMVPLYSVGSWLAMRFRSYAIYIETVRDLYESYVLYSFLQFLIQVLGGEEALVLMLKDKSPTRGVHMWGLQWCVKPWLMGQPYRKTVYERDNRGTSAVARSSSGNAVNSNDPLATSAPPPPAVSSRGRAVKRVMWKSPFFVRCKFGVLQYVLLKFVTAIAIMILERIGLYHEGDFSPWGAYFYICFITNLSQCWALYCLVFFYYATHNELSAIRPVGKFLSVKSLVFFTWWQSVMIAYLLWMDMIPNYSMKQQDWSPEDVAKGLQDYLICIEMFIIAIVHSFVFPHSEYTPQAVEARARALNLAPMTKWQKKRLGRSKYSSQYLLFRSDDSTNTPSLGTDVETELVSLTSESEVTGWASGNTTHFFTNESPQHVVPIGRTRSASEEEAFTDQVGPDDSMAGDERDSSGDDARAPSTGRRLDPAVVTEQDDEDEDDDEDEEMGIDELIDDDDSADEGGSNLVSNDSLDEEDERVGLVSGDASRGSSQKPGFMRAFLESAIPTDMVNSTVGIVKGDYNVERKTLLNHATASDQYDLFSPNRRIRSSFKKPPPAASKK